MPTITTLALAIANSCSLATPSAELMHGKISPLSGRTALQIIDQMPGFGQIEMAFDSYVQSGPSQWGINSTNFFVLANKVEADMRALHFCRLNDIRNATSRLVSRFEELFESNELPLSKFHKDLIESFPRESNEGDDAYRNRLLSEGLDGRLKCIFINRYLFNVPESEPASSDYETLFDCPITVMTADKSNVYRLLPLRVDSDGRIQIIGPIVLPGTGPWSYKALKEFDYFSTHYGRRQKWWRDTNR